MDVSGARVMVMRSFSSDPRKLKPRTPAELHQLFLREGEIHDRVGAALDRAAERVAFVARVGSDLSALRFEGEAPVFTHVAIALREPNGWKVDHLLNTFGGPRGDIYRQALIDFFRDDPFDYRTMILVPSLALQERIAAVLASPLRNVLYTPRYSRVAYPFSTRYLNSNQWVAEVVAAARSGARSREEAQRALAASGLRPSVLLGVGPVRQLFSALVSANTRLDDHPPRNRLRGRLEFILEVSLRAYLLATDDVRSFEIVDLQDSSRAPSA